MNYGNLSNESEIVITISKQVNFEFKTIILPVLGVIVTDLVGP